MGKLKLRGRKLSLTDQMILCAALWSIERADPEIRPALRSILRFAVS